MSTAILKKDPELSTLIQLYKSRDRCLALSYARDPEEIEILYRCKGDFGTEVYRAEGYQRLMPLIKRKLEEQSHHTTPSPSLVIWSGRLAGAKGRFSRSWWAPPGGLYLSFSIFPRLLRAHWNWYTISLGVSVAQVLREWGVPVTIRWINDLLLQGKKMCGILSETFHLEGEEYLLYGMGINVNILDFPPELEAISIAQASGSNWPIRPLAAHITARTAYNFALMEKWEREVIQGRIEGRIVPNPMLQMWKELSCSIGKGVIYGQDLEKEVEFKGRVIDFDGEGQIVIEDHQGHEARFNSGEIRYLKQTIAEDSPR